MGTLSATLTSVRLRIKDQYKNEFTDEELIDLTTEIMDQVFEGLRRMESNLVLQTTELLITAATDTYTLTTELDVVSGTVCIGQDNPLTMVYTPITDLPVGIPQFYMRLPTGEIKFMPTPDKDYTVSITSCAPYEVPTLLTLDTYDFPWSGIWNRAILRSLVLECLSVLERSVGVAVAQTGDAWDEATIATYNHGIIRRTMRGRLFYGL